MLKVYNYAMKSQNYRLIVSGIVQGVGFRPFVYNLATSLKLKGTIKNHTHCVEIMFYNLPLNTLKRVITLIKNNAPKNAKITDITYTTFSDSVVPKDFTITRTTNKNPTSSLALEVPKDYAICQDCLNDFHKPTRFESYAFTACTQCGARYSMLYALPYERENTAMREFALCKDCQKDYKNPANKRFHAQPISCKQCAIEFLFNGEKQNALQSCINALKKGKIVAVKGIGGFAFVIRADKAQSIAKLRARKNRPHKPFAILCKDMAQVRQIAYCNKKEQQTLQSKQSPIVLLSKKSLKNAKNTPLSQECLDLIAPKLNTIGILLPFSGILHLLFRFLNVPLIFTSANANGSPIATKSQELQNFAHIQDDTLDYNRAITNAIDDSVVRYINRDIRILRQARGYAPHTHIVSKKLHNSLTPQQCKILCFGANQKASFSLSDGTHIITSPYIGNLHNPSTLARYTHCLDNLVALYGFIPQIFVCDMHPQYATSALAQQFTNRTKGTKALHIAQCEFFKAKEGHFVVQHHYAHFCAILGEYKKCDKGQYLGITWDGTGFGVDSHIWGGEAFVGNLHSAKRVASFEEFSLLGGESAIKDIRRISLGLILEFAPQHKDLVQNDFSAQELHILEQMFEKNINSVRTSSVGRLFNALAHILGIIKNETYEGQCGAVLESYYDARIQTLYKTHFTNDLRIALAPIIQGICADKKARIKNTTIISKFFNTLAHIALLIAQRHISHISTNEVFFSGGVFANKILCEQIAKVLKKHNLQARFATIYPSGDECISVGQAFALLARIPKDS